MLISQYGPGKDVDVIVADDGAGWIGQPNFKTTVLVHPPMDYVGGNLLPGDGTCDLLDPVLDAIPLSDPDYFNADSRTQAYN